jgi:hypothetical protein
MQFNKQRSTNTMAQQHSKWILTAATAATFTGAQTLWTLTAGNEGRLGEFVPLVCPLMHFFGIQCPTCGLGRSTFLAFNGEITLALKFHPLGPVLLCGLLTATALAWIAPNALRSSWIHLRQLTKKPVFSWSAVGLYCLYGILRQL